MADLLSFGLLGPLEVTSDGAALRVSSGRRAAVLAFLLIHADQVVSVDRLIDELWDGAAAPASAKTVQVHISHLRKLLGAGVIVTHGHGYVLRLGGCQLDTRRFEALVERARSESPATAAETLREALDLWRGPALSDFEYERFVQPEISRLDEVRLSAIEDRVDADLALGRHVQLVPELEALTRAHPLRERLRVALMLALYRCGRQADALASYQVARRALMDSLGLAPGVELQQLEQAILRHDPALIAPSRAPERPTRLKGDDEAIHPVEVVPEEPQPALRAPPWPTQSRRGRRLLAMSGAALLLAAAGLFLWRSSQAVPVVLLPGDSAGLLDSGTGRLSAVAPLGFNPSGAASGFGAVWVSSGSANTVSRIDTSSGDVFPIQVGSPAIGTSPAGIATGAGAVWVADSGDGTVAEINPTVRRVVHTFRVGNGPTGVATIDHAVWITNSLDGTVARIDPAGERVTYLPVGVDPTAIVAGAGALWVTLESTGKVARIDPRTKRVTPPTINVGHGPNAIAYGFGSVWVANSLDETVWRIDPAPPFKVEKVFPVGADPQAITISRGAVWVANRGSGTISRIDPSADVPKTVRVGGDPTALTATSRGVWAGAMPAFSAHRGGTLRLVSAAPPDSIDPAVDYEFVGWDILHMTNDGLVAFKTVAGPDGFTVVPDLAEALPTPTDHGKSYTFKLRRGIHYSNGTTVRPEDIRRAIERLFEGLQPALASYYTGVVGAGRCLPSAGRSPVKRCDLSQGITVNERTNTITFHLTAANPDFLDELAIPPADAIPASTPRPGQTPHPLSATGPYMITRPTKSELVLVRNPYFHQWSRDAQPVGYPDRIVWRFGASASREVTAIEHNRADWTFDEIPNHGRLNEILTRYPAQVHVNVTPQTWYLFLNTRQPPFNKLLARRALSTAVNRGRITQLVRATAFGQPTCQVLPPNFPAYRHHRCPRVPDLARAKQMVAQSGTSGDHVTFWGFADPSEPALGKYIVKLLDQLGYRASLRIVRSHNLRYWKVVGNSTANAQLGMSLWYADYPTPGDFFLPVLSCHSFIPRSRGNQNLAEYCNPATDRLATRALNTQATNPAAANLQWAIVDRRVTQHAPWVPLFNPEGTDFVSKRVGNYQFDPEWTILLDQLWVH